MPRSKSLKGVNMWVNAKPWYKELQIQKWTTLICSWDGPPMKYDVQTELKYLTYEFLVFTLSLLCLQVYLPYRISTVYSVLCKWSVFWCTITCHSWHALSLAVFGVVWCVCEWPHDVQNVLYFATKLPTIHICLPSSQWVPVWILAKVSITLTKKVEIIKRHKSGEWITLPDASAMHWWV